ECLCRRRAEQAMRIVKRAKQRFLLITTAKFSNRTRRQKFLVKSISIFESAGTHACRWTYRVGGLVRIGNIEGAIFAAEKTSGCKCFQFLALADIKALPDIDERRDGRI